MKKVIHTLLISIFMLSMFSCGSSSDPKEVGKQFLLHLQNEEWDKAKELGTEGTKASIQMIVGFMEMSKQKDEKKKSKLEFGECEINGDEAVLHYTADGKEETLNLVKKDGEWLVDWKKEMGNN